VVTEEKAELFQEPLGILAGINEATASTRTSQYERGIHTPEFDLACRLAKIVKVPACYLYAVEDGLAKIPYYENEKKQ
jgi:transcriptional regulator with XRE-family HTH domain